MSRRHDERLEDAGRAVRLGHESRELGEGEHVDEVEEQLESS